MITQDGQFLKILVGKRVISAEKLASIMQSSGEDGTGLGQRLQDSGILQEGQYISLLVREGGYHYLNLDQAEIDPEAIREIPHQLARLLGIIPVRKAKDTLAVAMADPFHPQMLAKLKEAVPYNILPVISRKQEIDRALNRYQELGRRSNIKDIDWGIPLVPRFNFDSFVVSKGNEFPYAMAQSITKSPGETYNPLFLYSNVGLGKTHLLNAIGNRVLQEGSGKQLFYATCEHFNSKMVEAIKDNKIAEFRAAFNGINFLLIDDIEFMAGRDRIQEEFFHLFNILIQANKQIVVTSDRPPSELTVLENRLRSRFMGGTVASIDPPDLETRIAILKKKSSKVEIPAVVIQLLASRITSNIRELEGALNTLLSLNRFTQERFDTGTAEKILKEMGY